MLGAAASPLPTPSLVRPPPSHSPPRASLEARHPYPPHVRDAIPCPTAPESTPISTLTSPLPPPTL
ncbi:hypothetical protein K523DRAFT_326564, partial [Schizophyllum commune Tattone D]